MKPELKKELQEFSKVVGERADFVKTEMENLKLFLWMILKV